MKLTEIKSRTPKPHFSIVHLHSVNEGKLMIIVRSEGRWHQNVLPAIKRLARALNGDVPVKWSDIYIHEVPGHYDRETNTETAFGQADWDKLRQKESIRKAFRFLHIDANGRYWFV